MKSQRDEMILDLSRAHSQILKGWHDMCQASDTPSGLMKHRNHIYNHCAPSELLLGYGLKHEDAFQNTHLGRIRR